MFFLAVLEGIKTVHYHDDETHIRPLLEKYDLCQIAVPLWLLPRCGDRFSPFPTGNRSGNDTRRCWKRWCTVLAGSYLNKRKAAEMRLFQSTTVSAI